VSEPSQGPVPSTVQTFRHRIDHLEDEGRRLLESLERSPDSPDAETALGPWQRECAATISQLSGGVKAHWLSRAFSEALLVQVPPTESARVTTIVSRILAVLDRAARSLEQMEADAALGPAVEAVAPETPRQRFGFVQDEALRSHLESAYRDGRAALDRGESELALITFSSILEAVLTEALAGRGIDQRAPHDPPDGPVSDWPFESRIAMAERARLISNGCARLPAVARGYRGLLDAHGAIAPGVSVSANDARLALQVLHVVLRDLAPGR
jgi:hypothetical protein